MITLNIMNLKTNFSGNIILPNDTTYETARITYAVKDAKPAIIAQAKSTKDIAAVINFTKSNSLELSIRSGGHNVAGLSTNDNGMVLDLSLMNTIDIIDEKEGLVRLGPGALWGDVATELSKHDLALSSGDTKTVAVGGLTLGGGIGWMVRKYGYAIDSLVAAEIVLADGSAIRADASNHSDLFWALRGGGGNFGVVSSFEFKAHPQGKVVESTLTYGIDNLATTITGWRDYMRSAPEELTSFMTLMPTFGEAAPQIMIINCYAGDNLEQANTAIDPLRRLGNMTNDDTSVKEYADVLQVAHPPEGFKFVVKNMFAKTLSEQIATDLAELCCKPGSPIVQLRMMNGAASRVNVTATAIPHRDSEIFFMAVFPIPLDATDGQEAAQLKPWGNLVTQSSGAYSNFLSTNTNEDVHRIYPEATYQRLAKIKQIYDPKNIFHHNFNIKPAGESNTLAI
jgi:FAD/FMN-containing dehydrogenase